MSSIRPVYEFDVSETRLQKALAVYEDSVKALGREVVIDVFHELGFGEALGYEVDDEAGESRFTLDLTSVQFCALAAALAAVVESGGKQRLRDGRD